MEDQFHSQEAYAEADGVRYDSLAGRRGKWVAALADVVVEVDNWSCEIERRIEHVGEIIAESEVRNVSSDVDTIAFGEVCKVQVFLLARINSRSIDIMSNRTYLDRTVRPSVQRPYIVKIEGDESEHCNIEQDLPPRDQAAVAI